MIKLIGSIFVAGACLFDLLSYWKQISKTLRTKRSGQVSTSAYLMKISHYLCCLIAMTIFANWAGFIVALSAFLVCLVALSIVMKYKPRGWKLFRVGK